MKRLTNHKLYFTVYLLINFYLVFHSESSAAQWQSLPLNSTRHFTSVVFSNNVGIISSDDDYALYRSTDFGSNWTRENTGLVIHTKVITTKPHTFFVNGYNSGYIYHTKNDGMYLIVAKPNFCPRLLYDILRLLYHLRIRWYR